MSVPITTRTKVRHRLLDLSDTNQLLLDGSTLDEAINRALVRYSTDRPRNIMADVSGDDGPYYPLTGEEAVISGWLPGISNIESIEYPAEDVSPTYAPTYLDPTFGWKVYTAGDIAYVRFLGTKPAVGAKFRLTYTGLHAHTDALDTIPLTDIEAVCDLAASYACLMLATKASGNQDSIISADSTNYRDAQLRYSQMAKLWEDQYKTALDQGSAAGGGGVNAASAVADWSKYGAMRRRMRVV